MQEMLHNAEMLSPTATINNSIRNHEIFTPGSALDLKEPHGIYVRFVKPWLDVLFAVILLLLTIPLNLAVAILIKLDSEGPVLFKQQRYGKNGKVFWIYKFRTMYAYVPIQGRSPESNRDVRITPVGCLLRKISIDEIPQIINILKGDMSFIGPRPEQKDIVDRYYTSKDYPRLCVKPGITGLWQISAHRKYPIHENLQYDLFYVEHLSLCLDIRIAVSTIQVMIKSNTY